MFVRLSGQRVEGEVALRLAESQGQDEGSEAESDSTDFHDMFLRRFRTVSNVWLLLGTNVYKHEYI